MKKKFNPNQIVLDLFPIEGVAAVNEASIRDFRQAYWTGDGIKSPWIGEEMSDAFITRLAWDAAASKAALRKMMARSEKWRESLQEWVIPFSVKVPVKPAAVRKMIMDMWRGVVRRGKPFDNSGHTRRA